MVKARRLACFLEVDTFCSRQTNHPRRFHHILQFYDLRHNEELAEARAKQPCSLKAANRRKLVFSLYSSKCLAGTETFTTEHLF